jgi:hypothetical protein
MLLVFRSIARQVKAVRKIWVLDLLTLEARTLKLGQVVRATLTQFLHEHSLLACACQISNRQLQEF